MGYRVAHALIEAEFAALDVKPGSPGQWAHVESFVSRLRDEILDVEVFHNLAVAQV